MDIISTGILHTYANSILHTRPIAFGPSKPMPIPDILMSVCMPMRIPIYSKNHSPISLIGEWFNDYGRTIHQFCPLVNSSITMVEPFPNFVDWGMV